MLALEQPPQSMGIEHALVLAPAARRYHAIVPRRGFEQIRGNAAAIGIPSRHVILQRQLELVRVGAKASDDFLRQVIRRALAQLFAGASEAKASDRRRLKDRGGNDSRGGGQGDRIGHGQKLEQTENCR